jgi:hypothetical protein
VRTYLDSGVFTIVRKAGTTRIRIARADNAGPLVTYAEFKDHAERYIDYLKVHKDAWDHIIELDVDEPEWFISDDMWIEGIDLAESYRKRLREVVGDKLMPAWHVQRGEEGWTDMIHNYPYVAIGSDTSVARSTASRRPPMDPTILRRMVQEAHQAGVGVHYLGDTRYRTFIQCELDSADSTTWVSAGRFGQFPGPKGQSIRYTTKGDKGLARQQLDWQRTIRPIDMSRARSFEDLMTSWGIDPEKILSGSQEERLGSNIKLLLARQKEIRHAREAFEISSGSC